MYLFLWHIQGIKENIQQFEMYTTKKWLVAESKRWYSRMWECLQYAAK
jgi:hypothetical protein